MSQTVLVTGGAGYIGSHACKALKREGYTPVTLDNFVYGHESFVKWGPLVRGDTQDTDLVRSTIERYGVIAVMHFAAFAYVGESMTDPARYYENNVAGTLSLLKGMRGTNCNSFVFSSTCATYGEQDAPITESTPQTPVNPYGRSKLFCEHILSDYANAYGLSYTALRYFNASGDDPDGEVGEKRELETHLIPRAMMSLQGYIDDFAVFGADFPTPDGTAIRDYIHVVDLAEAHVLALKRMLAGAKGGAAFNLGTGRGYSVSEVLAMIRDVTGHEIASANGARRPGDPTSLVADASLARRELGFSATHSDLRTIVETAWRWHLAAHPRRNAEAAAPSRI